MSFSVMCMAKLEGGGGTGKDICLRSKVMPLVSKRIVLKSGLSFLVNRFKRAGDYPEVGMAPRCELYLSGWS